MNGKPRKDETDMGVPGDRCGSTPLSLHSSPSRFRSRTKELEPRAETLILVVRWNGKIVAESRV